MVRSICLGLALLLPASAALAQGGGLPDGVTSVQEVYQDWRVNCVQGQPAVKCSMSQEQAQNGQRLLAIELTSSKDGAASGMLVLPFGLELSAGAVLQVDDGSADPARAFKTCVPGGCVIPLTFDKARVDALSKGKVLSVQVVASDNGQAASFGISLKGFGGALARTVALSQ